MKRFSLLFLSFASATLVSIRAETESIDLKALAKKARPAVMLLVVSDANGKEIATGTGFLVSSDGKLITNHHVIEGATSAVAKSENGGLFPIDGVLADDPTNDLVLLKLKGRDLPFLTLDNSGTVEVGTRIAIIGSPLGLEGTLSEGIVSALRKLKGDVNVLQITAAISPGSSGSPVINANGYVVGIASSLLGGGQALNFAVPVVCANRLSANVKPVDIPKPLDQSGKGTGKEEMIGDPDLNTYVIAALRHDGVEMLRHAKVLVVHYPGNALAWCILGEAFSELNFTDEKIAAYQHAIKIRPDHVAAWFNLAAAYDETGRTDDAVAAYRQAIKIKPDCDFCWYGLGKCLQKLRQFDEAHDAFNRAESLKSKSGK